MENSTTKKKSNQHIIFTILRQKVYNKLFKKYSSNKYSFNTISINHIIYNEPCQIVAKFKDFLVYGDYAEFIRKYYYLSESVTRLFKILNLYEKYSKIFPNYLVLNQKEYMFRNIRKKQKVVDALNQILNEEKRNKLYHDIKKNNNNNQLFTNLVKEEIKLFQKNTTFRKYKNSFDSESNKEDTIPQQSSFSIKRKSLNSIKTNETNSTLSCLLNIMNDHKIYPKDLQNLIKINGQTRNPKKPKNIDVNRDNKDNKDNNIIFKKYIQTEVTKSNHKINNLKKAKKNPENKSKSKSKGTDTKENIKNLFTPEKKREEISIGIGKTNFTSNLLTQKKIKKMNPSLNNLNNYNSNSSIEKQVTLRQNMISTTLGESLNNNKYLLSPFQTVTYGQPKKKLYINNYLNYNVKLLKNNNSKEKDNKIILYSNNNMTTSNNNNNNNNNNKVVVIHQKNNSKNKAKNKHISQDFSYKNKENKNINNKR